jgi:hypothetical protein
MICGSVVVNDSACERRPDRWVRRPGSACRMDAAELHASPDSRGAVFAGTLTEKLEGNSKIKTGTGYPMLIGLNAADRRPP